MMRTQARWQIRIFFIIWLLFLWTFVKAPFTFLILNTFLGYIPIEISFHIRNNFPKNGIIFWALIILWLLFYPNAPYLMTDLFHLSLLNPYTYDGLLRSTLHIWIYFTIELISVLFCVFLGFWSLNHVAGTITERYFKRARWLEVVFVLILTFLSSVGIYAGRFLRIHTIYLFISPDLIIHRLMGMWTASMLEFVGLMMIIQLLAYWLSHLVYNQQLGRTNHDDNK